MASHNVRVNKTRAFRTGRELAKENTGTGKKKGSALSPEERMIQDRIQTLEYVVYGKPDMADSDPRPALRRPYNRERLERNKSWRMALEALFLTLLILGIIGLLNQRFHFFG